MKKNKFSIRNKPSLYKERMAVQRWLKLDPRHRKELLARQSILLQPSSEQNIISLGEAGSLLEDSFASLEADLESVETPPHHNLDNYSGVSPENEKKKLTPQKLSQGKSQASADLGVPEFEGFWIDSTSEISCELMEKFVTELKSLAEDFEGQTFLLDLGDQLLLSDKDVVPPELQAKNPITVPKNLEARKMEEKIKEKRKDKKVTVVNPPPSRLKN